MSGYVLSIIETVDAPDEGSGWEKDSLSMDMIPPSCGNNKTWKNVVTTTCIE
jgi:hypothetical protein